MANKPTKPVHQAKVFTPEQIQEQKKNQALQFLAQRREQFAINILASMVRGNIPSLELGKEAVDTAVKMADHLMSKLYPINGENAE